MYMRMHNKAFGRFRVRGKEGRKGGEGRGSLTFFFFVEFGCNTILITVRRPVGTRARAHDVTLKSVRCPMHTHRDRILLNLEVFFFFF